MQLLETQILYLGLIMTNLSTIFTPALWLQDAGFGAYIVGNQVRDLLLGTESDRNDVDIATSALPQEVVSVLRRNNIIPSIVDEKFGTVAFVYEGKHYEVTTFRQDIYHGDFSVIKRYPDEIKFVKLVAQDAERRDFTINAIYYNPKTKRYLDYLGGQKDLKSKTLRAIGDPEIRFQEDPIRILRAIRMHHALGFKYETKTAKQIEQLAGAVKKVSPGVVKKELQKLQQLPQYPAMREELKSLGLIQVV